MSPLTHVTHRPPNPRCTEQHNRIPRSSVRRVHGGTSIGATSDGVASGLKRRPESAWCVAGGPDTTGGGTPDLREPDNRESDGEFIIALRPPCDAESSGARVKEPRAASRGYNDGRSPDALLAIWSGVGDRASLM
ncbi:hypothetical protein A0H81_03867 [Grifola frondosa]|uniref:Uncharacterized protein n=1 Tax=Grifola frondosa TaxID=5627 RepID=A0A1C7MJQ0_GRIFR|nr:hypothetical protein A0H81_03867 [Grifola frondosa]